MTAYATRADVYKYALPRGALGNPGRLAASSLASTSTIELIEHGFVAGDPITFRATDGGALSAPLVAGTIYYVLPVTDSAFQVSAAPLGSPITLTTDGANVVVTADLPFDSLCELYSRWVDDLLPAHAVPLQAPFPIVVVGVVATLVAKRAQMLSGEKSISMDDAELAAKAQIDRWSKGIPDRQASLVATPTNLAVTHSHREGPIGFVVRGDFRGGINGPSDNGGFNQ